MLLGLGAFGVVKFQHKNIVPFCDRTHENVHFTFSISNTPFCRRVNNNSKYIFKIVYITVEK